MATKPTIQSQIIIDMLEAASAVALKLHAHLLLQQAKDLNAVSNEVLTPAFLRYEGK